MHRWKGGREGARRLKSAKKDIRWQSIDNYDNLKKRSAISFNSVTVYACSDLCSFVHCDSIPLVNKPAVGLLRS